MLPIGLSPIRSYPHGLVLIWRCPTTFASSSPTVTAKVELFWIHRLRLNVIQKRFSPALFNLNERLRTGINMAQHNSMIQNVCNTLVAIPSCPSNFLTIGLRVFGRSIWMYDYEHLGSQRPFWGLLLLLSDWKDSKMFCLLAAGVHECIISMRTFSWSFPTNICFPKRALIVA